MAGAKMVDKTNMSLDDIIKMDRKNKKTKPGFITNKNSLARNAVKKAKNSFINRKNINLPQRNMNISNKRQDVRSRLIKNKQMNISNNNNNNNMGPRNVQKSTRNSNVPRQNQFLNNNNNNRSRINNRINTKVTNSAPAFRITTNNERYQSSNRGKPTFYKRFQNDNNNETRTSSSFSNSNRNQMINFPRNDRRPTERNNQYNQFARRNNSAAGGYVANRNSVLARDREYEVMARALIEAHKESRYSLSQRRYTGGGAGGPFGTRGYPYRR